jgi:predicted dehydrogenase
MIKTGVLGCGMIGLSFIKQLKKHNKFELISLCSKQSSSLQSASSLAPNAKLYTNKESFFKDTETQAIIICTPHTHHANDALLAIKAGKHALIEKPIATNKKELAALLCESKLHPKQIITALPHGDFQFLDLARQLINDGAVGKITSIHSYLDVPGPERSNWYYSKEARGGATLDTLPYALGRVMNLIQNNVTEVVGLKNQMIFYRACGDGGRVSPEVDDNVSLILLFPEGQQAIVRSNWNTSKASDFLDVNGRKGTIRIDAWRNRVFLETDQKVNVTGMKKIKRHLYQINLPKSDPEKLKLDVFYNHITQKSGNLKEVSYFMEIILSILSKNGVASLPLSYYSESLIQDNLSLDNNYI